MAAEARGLQSSVDHPFSDYELADAFDEMFGTPGRPRPHYEELYRRLLEQSREELWRSKQQADISFL